MTYIAGGAISLPPFLKKIKKPGERVRCRAEWGVKSGWLLAVGNAYSANGQWLTANSAELN
jgi:hypothetical protein